MQLELALRAAEPSSAKADVPRLVELLRGRRWLASKEILLAAPDLTDRRLRAIAEASDGAIVSYPGSPGYCLFDETTEAEISHAIDAMRSQGRRMIERSVALERRHHRRRLVVPFQGPAAT